MKKKMIISIYFWIIYRQFGRKELVECHKIPQSTRKKESGVVSIKDNKFNYYKKYASSRSRNIEKEDELQTAMGDSWEYLYFSTRFEIYYIINKQKLTVLNNDNFVNILYSSFKIARNYRDYQKNLV